MGAPKFHEPKPGDKVRASDEAEVRRYLQQVGNSFSAPVGHAGPEGNQVGRPREMPWVRVAQITEVDCDNPHRHAWEEVISDPSDGDEFDTLGDDATREESGDVEKWYCISTELTEWIPVGTVVLVSPFYNQENELIFICHFVHDAFWSRIIDNNDEDGDYSWVEQEPDGSGGLQNMPGGRSGTLNARDVNDELCISNGTIVRMVFSEKLDCDGSPEDRYLFEYRPNLDDWWEIDSASPGNNLGPVYEASLLVHDGDGDLELAAPAVETDFLREVNGTTGLAQGSDRRVFGHFLGLSDDGDPNNFTKRYAFWLIPSGGGGGCTDVWRTIQGDSGDSLVASGCNDTLKFVGAGGITVTPTLGVPDTVEIDGSGIGAGVQFWGRIDSRSAGNVYNYTKLDDNLDPTVNTGTAKEVNGNDLINTNGSGGSPDPRPIVRIFADDDGNEEHFEFQELIKARLLSATGSGSYTFQGVTILNMDIAGYTGSCEEVNNHPFLQTDTEIGSGNGLNVILQQLEVGAPIEFSMPTGRRHFWAQITSRDCNFATSDVYNITPKREEVGGTLVTDTKNIKAIRAREVNGNEGVDRILGPNAIVLVTQMIDLEDAIEPENNYYFNANIQETWYEITSEAGLGDYNAKRLDADMVEIETCAGAEIFDTINEKHQMRKVPIGTRVRCVHTLDYFGNIFFSFGENGFAQIGTVAKDGGVNGDASTTATITYQITDVNGGIVDSLVSPDQARLVNTPYLEAAAGGRSARCYYSVEAAVVTLMHVPGEIPDNTPCP